MDKDTSLTTINSEEKNNAQPKPLETEMDQTNERKKQKQVGYVLKKGKYPGRMDCKTGNLKGGEGRGEAKEKAFEGKTQNQQLERNGVITAVNYDTAQLNIIVTTGSIPFYSRLLSPLTPELNICSDQQKTGI